MTRLKQKSLAGMAFFAMISVPALAYASDGIQLTSLHYALAGFASFFGIGLFAGFFWFRSREEQSAGDETIYDIEEKTQLQTKRGERTTVSRSTPSTGINLDELPSWPTMAQWLPPRVDEKHCPQCKRTFDPTVVICPFDSSELVDAPQKGRVPTVTEHPGCTSCGRLYDVGTRYCREDGQRLSPSAKIQAVIVDVCQNCGDERLDSVARCCDEPEIQSYDPENLSRIRPMLPLNECPMCHARHSPGESHCEHDGEVLRPVLNLNRRLLAPTGQGPRRKICPDCGRRFSGSSGYCSFDGTELEDLN